MNYIGSKLSLLEFLEESIQAVVGEETCKTFCDLFAGTGVVGTHFKKKGYIIISNDIQYYSYVLCKHFIGNNHELTFQKISGEISELVGINVTKRKEFVCDYLSNIPGVEGYIYKNYCLGGTQGTEIERQYFSDYNGKLCDAIRLKIEDWKSKAYISEQEYYYLLSCLLESIDSLANTASVYGAFLKKIKPTAKKNLVLKPTPIIKSSKKHIIYNQNINDLIKNIRGDIMYLDPPYNHRQYDANYHMLETIALYDNPEICGKTGLRSEKDKKSLFCSKIKVKQTFEDLIMNADMKYIFVSYNDEGLLTHDDLREILSRKGEYSCFTKKYFRYKSDKDQNRTYKSKNTLEYLHCVKCFG